MKLLLIAKNNIKRSIGTTIVLFCLIVLASVMLYTAVSVEQRLDTFINEKNDEVNGADFIMMASEKQQDEALKVLEERSEVALKESHIGLDYGSPTIANKSRDGKEQVLETILFNAEDSYQIAKLSYVSKLKEIPENAAYVPYSLHIGFGYELGDTISLTSSGKSHEFKIAGFYENVIFGNQSNYSIYEFFIPKELYTTIREEKTYNSILIQTNVTLKEGTDDAKFSKDISQEVKEKIGEGNGQFYTLCYSTMLEGSKIFVNIMMMVLLAFSLILLVIALVVIRFAIIVHIEKNMKNIGALEAIGYTGRQMKHAILIEFELIAGVSTVAGLLLAIASSKVVGKVVSASIGLDWISHISLLGIVVSVLVIGILIFLVTSQTAHKISKITPLRALRNGIETHNFKKNRVPLDQTKLGVNAAVGIKGLFHNMKQNVVIVIIVSLLSFASVFVIGMLYNFVMDNRALINLVGIENSELQFSLPGENRKEIFDEVSKMEGVKKIIYMDGTELNIANATDSISVRAEVTDDFSLLKVKTLVEGRLPAHDNEVVVSKRSMDSLGLHIGDSVSVSSYGKTAEYLIVGMKQHTNNLGNGISITTEGMKRLKPDYEINSINIYLNEGVSSTKFAEKLNVKYSKEERSVYNMEQTIDTVMNSFNSAIMILCIGCGVITIFVVVLILLLLIKVKIIKEQTHLAILKGLGYTTNQLIRQMLYSFLPVILAGTFIGFVMGALFSNSFVAVLLGSVGIMKVEFVMPYLWILFVPVVIGLVATVTIWIMGRRIHKITVTSLFTE